MERSPAYGDAGLSALLGLLAADVAVLLAGALLAGLRYYRHDASDALLASVVTGGIAVVAA